MVMIRFEKFVKTAPVLSDEGTGRIEGYASVFDVIDRQGEVVLKGAFKRTILERVSAGKVFLTNKHLGNGAGLPDTIGVIDKAKEDKYGFWISAAFFDTPEAQSARRQSASSNMGFSIGGEARYETIKKDGLFVPALVEVKLDEVTVTPFPACDEARVSVVKSLNGIPENADDPPPALPETAPADMAPDVALIVAKAQAWLALQEMQITMKEITQ